VFPIVHLLISEHTFQNKTWTHTCLSLCGRVYLLWHSSLRFFATLCGNPCVFSLLFIANSLPFLMFISFQNRFTQSTF
jgi:hypothetical protein